MSTSLNHQQHTEFIKSALDALNQLLVADPETIRQLARAAQHSCEPDYQLILELPTADPAVNLTLVIDLEADSQIDTAEIFGTEDQRTRHVLIDHGFASLQAIVDAHLKQEQHSA